MQQKHLGALSEHKAIIWLIEKGLEVFRNVSPFGGVDIISRDPITGVMKVYDVTSGKYYKKQDGSISLMWAKSKLGKGVTVLVVFPDNQILEFSDS